MREFLSRVNIGDCVDVSVVFEVLKLGFGVYSCL